MKKLLLALIVIVGVATCQSQTPQELVEKNKILDSTKVVLPESFHPKVNQIVTELLSRYHYSSKELNDSLSTVIFDEYVGTLDHSKMYFLASDIKQFKNWETQFDDFLKVGMLSAPYEIFNLYKKRVGERIAFIEKQLAEGFDFTIDEYYEPDREDAPWPESRDELDELWRKKLKHEALRLKLTDKEWDKITESLEKRYHSFHKAVLQYEAEDVFQVYLNSFGEAVDPHTSYFSPRTSENFNIHMSLSLEGIGAQLTIRDEYTTVSRIITGGPAFKQGELKKDDRIIGVAQGEEGEMVDVIGWRLDDVVQLIRGEKGTLVRLQVLKADEGEDAPPEEIRIVRDKVKLEEQAAKKEVIEINENGTLFKLGVIDIPEFYLDFEALRNGEEDYKSTSRDVKKLLEELKEEGVDGIIVDLRNNGGGSLKEAIELTGLFIEEGPVVQVRNSNNVVEVNNDPDPSIVYDGPLVVLVNEYSASASEIFSAAIQDYERGLIVGEQTFGKGTVQNLIDLSKYFQVEGTKLGQVKLTIAKFYRVNGGATQHMGVVPDLIYPSVLPPEEYGESSKPSALPWDKIGSLEYEKFQDLDPIIPALQERHLSRVEKNLEWGFFVDDLMEMAEARNKKKFSLSEDVRLREKEERETREKERDAERAADTPIELTTEEEVKEEEPALAQEDPLLEETGHILADYIMLSNGEQLKLQTKADED